MPYVISLALLLELKMFGHMLGRLIAAPCKLLGVLDCFCLFWYEIELLFFLDTPGHCRSRHCLKADCTPVCGISSGQDWGGGREGW